MCRKNNIRIDRLICVTNFKKTRFYCNFLFETVIYFGLTGAIRSAAEPPSGCDSRLTARPKRPKGEVLLGMVVKVTFQPKWATLLVPWKIIFKLVKKLFK